MLAAAGAGGVGRRTVQQPARTGSRAQGGPGITSQILACEGLSVRSITVLAHRCVAFMAHRTETDVKRPRNGTLYRR